MIKEKKIGAVIEVGTNSVKLLVAFVGEGGIPENIAYQRKITRLGEGLEKSGRLLPQATTRTIDAIEEKASWAAEKGAEKVFVVGTYALRAAKNSSDFTDLLKKETGLELEILSGEEEAWFTRDGAVMDFPESVVIDIGGGSTEVADDESAFSLPFGVVSITEKFLKNDPPENGEILEAGLFARRLYEKEINFLKPGREFSLIGVGGTITAAAALSLGLDKYEAERIRGFTLSIEDVEEVLLRLKSVNLDKRKMMMKFDPDRADVIIAGIVILKNFLEFFHVKKITVSVKNIIHGVFRNKFR